MNPETLTITLPDEKPPIVDAKQRIEVGGTIFQVRLTLTNNMLPESVYQEPLSPVSMEQQTKQILAALAERKPEKPKTDSPFLKRKEAIQLLKTRSILEACEKAGWLKATTRRPRLVLYRRTDVMACVYRISQGEYPS
jgi:hypothetical protein